MPVLVHARVRHYCRLLRLPANLHWRTRLSFCECYANPCVDGRLAATIRVLDSNPSKATSWRFNSPSRHHLSYLFSAVCWDLTSLSRLISGTNLGTVNILFTFNRLRVSYVAITSNLIYRFSVVYARLRSARRINGPPKRHSPGTARRYQISGLTTYYGGCLSTSESATAGKIPLSSQ